MLTTASAIVAASSIVEGVTPEPAVSAARGRKAHRIISSTDVFVTIGFRFPSFLPYFFKVGQEVDDFL